MAKVTAPQITQKRALSAALALVALVAIAGAVIWAWLWNADIEVPEGATLSATRISVPEGTPVLNLTAADLDALPAEGASVVRRAVEEGAASANLNETQVREWNRALAVLGSRVGMPDPSFLGVDGVVISIGLVRP